MAFYPQFYSQNSDSFLDICHIIYYVLNPPGASNSSWNKTQSPYSVPHITYPIIILSLSNLSVFHITSFVLPWTWQASFPFKSVLPTVPSIGATSPGIFMVHSFIHSGTIQMHILVCHVKQYFSITIYNLILLYCSPYNTSIQLCTYPLVTSIQLYICLSILLRFIICPTPLECKPH